MKSYIKIRRQNKIWRKLLIHFKQNELLFEDTTNIKEITEREIEGMQHLAGYAVTTYKKVSYGPKRV